MLECVCLVYLASAQCVVSAAGDARSSWRARAMSSIQASHGLQAAAIRCGARSISVCDLCRCDVEEVAVLPVSGGPAIS